MKGLNKLRLDLINWTTISRASKPRLAIQGLSKKTQ